MRHRYCVIAAVDINGGYSKNGIIPWYYPEDFKWFKTHTIGHRCVMGRLTYEDINKRLGDKALPSVLPNRDCFVLSNTLTELPNATVIKTLPEMDIITPDTDTTVFIIGGGTLFNMGVLIADTVILTQIQGDYDCDKFLPIDYIKNNFDITEVEESNDGMLSFYTMKRNNTIPSIW